MPDGAVRNPASGVGKHYGCLRWRIESLMQALDDNVPAAGIAEVIITESQVRSVCTVRYERCIVAPCDLHYRSGIRYDSLVSGRSDYDCPYGRIPYQDLLYIVCRHGPRERQVAVGNGHERHGRVAGKFQRMPHGQVAVHRDKDLRARHLCITGGDGGKEHRGGSPYRDISSLGSPEHCSGSLHVLYQS